ncbi:hypothetical protein [uncultured Rikenella sp.]|uniref:hypothetical protein n=1 Tax=uncultured Rikenella sp. TaxID=368003 RepID=UPI00260A8E8A|nr:hypothetical protein [uncultured Rikenella sp.]
MAHPRSAQPEHDRLKATFHKPAGFAPHHPAPGYRHRDTGDLSGIGYLGYSWSYTPVTGDITVRYLDFRTQALYTSAAHYRGHGFQLRCLSE